MRKLNYGSQQLVVSSVMREIAEEIADLTLRYEDQKSNVSAEIMKNHRKNIAGMISARSDILLDLSKSLTKEAQKP